MNNHRINVCIATIILLFIMLFFQTKPVQKVQEKFEEEEDEKVTLDLSKLTKREKLQVSCSVVKKQDFFKCNMEPEGKKMLKNQSVISASELCSFVVVCLPTNRPGMFNIRHKYSL